MGQYVLKFNVCVCVSACACVCVCVVSLVNHRHTIKYPFYNNHIEVSITIKLILV